MNLELISDYLKSKPAISFAYIFGSAITPYYIPGKSDIDIAIFGDRPFEFNELVELSNDLSELLPNHPEIDLVDFMTDAPVLINEIIEKGQVLFIKNTLMHDEFVCTAWSRYIDHKEWIKQFDDVLKEGILTQTNRS